MPNRMADQEPASFSLDPLPGTTAVAIHLSDARHGWINLTIRCGDQKEVIGCSDVFNPFADITLWLDRIADGANGAVQIDEEGSITCLWLDREPGALTGRLRVFEPGSWGEPKTTRIDAVVDMAQLINEWHAKFSAYVEVYDAAHWDQSPTFDDDNVEIEAQPVRTLAQVNLERLEIALLCFGLKPDNGGHYWSEMALQHTNARHAYRARSGLRTPAEIHR